ncbi:MAG TPA: hypothetical protein VF916_04815, partial [Ktedonobacterales bacterium]
DGYHLAYGNYQVDPASACGALVAWSPPPRVLTGFYPNQPSFVVVRYRSSHPQALRLTLSIPHFTQEQSFDVQGTATFQAQAFKPPLVDANILDTLVGPHARDGQIVLRVQNGAGKVCDTSSPVRLESRQLMQWQDDAGHDQAGYLAGWVTPQASAVSALVSASTDWLAAPAHASDYPAAPALFGYNSGKASGRAVIDQVNALFDTLQFQSHVHYVDSNVPYQQGGSQLIQLPKDVLSTTPPTGMCVETTVLMASAVERIGLRPFIIIVPQHAFLGVALGVAPDAPLAYWETSDLNGGVRGDQANVHGESEYNQFHSKDQILRVVDVEQERQLGIEPIE